MGFLNFFKMSAPKPLRTDLSEEGQRKLHRSFAFQSFVAGTLGYSFYYVCRAAINVMKKPIIDSGLLNADDLGTIGAVGLATYAIGKFVNGFLADYSNIKRFMATGLIVSASACLCMGVIGLSGSKALDSVKAEETKTEVVASVEQPTVETKGEVLVAENTSVAPTTDKKEVLTAENVSAAPVQQADSLKTTTVAEATVAEASASVEKASESNKATKISFLVFIAFAILWGVSGWGQSMGSPPAIIALSRWYPLSKRGTYYGFFSASHNIGEGLSFVFVGLIVAGAGWQWGFFGAAIAGLVGVLIILLLMHDTPESKGLPSVEVFAKEKVSGKSVSAKEAQRIALRSPAVWILALASAFMYISRYSLNSWGVLFMQEAKGYTLGQASIIISINAWMGVLGTVLAGWMSDTLFKGDRKMPAFVSGVLLSISYILFIYGGNALWITSVSLALFGVAIGVLIAFLGGLMAVDVVPRNATGAALGIVGMVSYAAASIQEKVSGALVNNNITINEAGEKVYDFSEAAIFWIGASVISFLLPMLLWGKKKVNE